MDKTIETPMALVRVSMHSRVRSSRATIAEKLLSAGFGKLDIAHGQEKANRTGILYARGKGDAIRAGLAYHLKGKLKGFSADGKSFKILSVNQKGLQPGELGILLDLQEADSDTSYGKIGRVSMASDGSSIAFEPGPAFNKLPSEMQKILQDPGDLQRMGQESLFDADLRAITEYLFSTSKFSKLWSGQFLAYGPEQIRKAREIREILSETLEGKYTLGVLTLHAGPENRKALGEDIEQEYIDSLEKKLSALEDAQKGNVKRIKGEVEEMQASVTTLEASLGYTFSDQYHEALSPVLARLTGYEMQWQQEAVEKGTGSGKTKAELASEIAAMQARIKELEEAALQATAEKKTSNKTKK